MTMKAADQGSSLSWIPAQDSVQSQSQESNQSQETAAPNSQTQLLWRLCQRHQQSHQFAFSLRLLHSRLLPKCQTVAQVESMIRRHLLSSMNASLKDGDAGAVDRVQKTQQLIRHLVSLQTLQRPFASLYFLYALCSSAAAEEDGSFVDAGAESVNESYWMMPSLLHSSSIAPSASVSSFMPAAAVPQTMPATMNTMNTTVASVPSHALPPHVLVTENQWIRALVYCFQGLEARPHLCWDGTQYQLKSSTATTASVPAAGTTQPVWVLSNGQRAMVESMMDMGTRVRYCLSQLQLEEKEDAVMMLKDGNEKKGEAVMGRSLVQQSYLGALRQEMQHHLEFCAFLEQQLSRMAVSLSEQDSNGKGQWMEKKNGMDRPLTLRQLMVWSEGPKQRLAWIERCLRVLDGKRSTEVPVSQKKETNNNTVPPANDLAVRILDHLYLMAKDGDPLCRAFAERVLTACTRPYFAILERWVREGVLVDPYLEFFVQYQQPSQHQPSSSLGSGKAALVAIGEGSQPWRDRFRVVSSLIPRFLGKDVAEWILVIGKTLDFLEHVCGRESGNADPDRVRGWLSVEVVGVHPPPTAFSYAHWTSLKPWFHTVYDALNTHLRATILERHHLVRHLRALKDYLLLGNGDFLQGLMEDVQGLLGCPARTLLRHNLTGMLESAVRGSTAQYDHPDVLQRLDVRLLEVQQPGAGGESATGGELEETGWDVFSLDYHVTQPLSTLVTPECLMCYLRLFHFLFRVKRVEFALRCAWQRQMTGWRAWNRIKEGRLPGSATGVGGGVATIPSGDGGVLARLLEDSVWERVNEGGMSEMVHFTYQLQYFILFEVVESAWGALMVVLERGAGDLNALVNAHAAYLQFISERCLLSTGVVGGKAAAAGAESMAWMQDVRSPYLEQLLELMGIMLEFSAVHSRFFEIVSKCTDFDVEMARTIQQRTARGEWGQTAADVTRRDHVTKEFKKEMATVEQEMQTLLKEFRAGVKVFLEKIGKETAFTSLAARLNYNGCYSDARDVSKRLF